MTNEQFKEALLEVMEAKTHWAWPFFTSGKVAEASLHYHFEQEYESYVRDFPIMVGWAYVQCPVAEVRRELAENLYEEETGGLVAKKPHPELFLEYPRGLGMDMARFESIELLPEARAYRDCIDGWIRNRGWVAAACVTTIFIEGTSHERGEVDETAAKRPTPRLEDHPLVVHYGLPLESLALTKAHRQVEGEHRTSAWQSILGHAPDDQRELATQAMKEVLAAWRSYRDGVARVCGLARESETL